MSLPLLFAMPGNAAMGGRLAELGVGETGAVEIRRFPDGETYLRFAADVTDRDIVLVCTLDRPDAKFLPLMLAAETARQLGARSVGLVAPYLAYLRQDKRFHPGEATAAAIFGQALGGVSDWLITIDPHLHRLASIGAVYPRSASVLHAIAPVAAWIRNHVEEPLIVGPDVESRQWTETVANAAGAPFIVMEKTRRGDRAVEVTAPDLAGVENRTPVLLDDIISTARTMIAAMALLRQNAMKPAVCVGIHGVFAEGAYEDLLAAGAVRVASTNTIAHLSNAIDVSGLIAEALRERFAIP